MAEAKLEVRSTLGFASGGIIGSLGGLIGLGGAEFRLPLLVGLFRLETLQAVVFNKAMSLIVVASSLCTRGAAPSALQDLIGNIDIVFNLLAGSLIGAWWAAGRAMKISRQQLDQIIFVLLAGLSILMLFEAFFGLHGSAAALVGEGLARFIAGVAAGFGIGTVAALLGVAGGELLIPTIVLLYGFDVKLAGSLSLMVSFPTMVVGFLRYSSGDAFVVLKREKRLLLWMTIGSMIGAALGSLLAGAVPVPWLTGLLGVILLLSAVKTFVHTRH